MNAVGKGNYHVEFNRVIAAAESRFSEKKRTGWSGYLEPSYKGNMAAKAYKKLNKLANNRSENPLKDAADVMNFCVFFFMQHSKEEDQSEV